MPIVRVTRADDPRIADYRGVPDPELLRRGGLFVAENRLVVRALLACPRFETRSVLVTDAAFDNLRDMLEPRLDSLSVFVCDTALMQPIAGFNVHRGCLALAARPAPLAVEQWLRGAAGAVRVVVLEAITNADNIGGIFRSARAFGFDAVLLGPRCCDPLYRKSVRVSIGAALQVPFAFAADWPTDLAALETHGFTSVALTPGADAVALEPFARGPLPDKLALVVGNEGDGLSAEALRGCAARVRIPMAGGVDSLNVATAAAIAMYALRPPAIGA